MKIIADMNDAVYYQQRAREFIHDSEISLRDRDGQAAKQNLRNAISLLALALTKYDT